MNIFHCSVYKIRGAQPPAEVTTVSLDNGCTLIVSSDLEHIQVDYFRADILPQIMLSGFFHQAPGLSGSDDLDQRTALHREKIVAAEVGACYLTILSESEENEPIAKTHGQIGPYLIAVLNATAPTASQSFHKIIVYAAISALAVLTRNMDRAEKIFEAIYRSHEEHDIVHYCAFSGYVEASVISQLPSNFDSDFRAISQRLSENQDLASVFRLLASSYTQRTDKLASFLGAWSAIEIFVNKAFPSQVKKFFDAIESSHKDFVARLQEVMKDKYRLADKFALISSTISADTAIDDIKTFKGIKKTRDELLHGADVDTSRLPLEPTQALLRRYLLAYIKAMQT